MELDNNNHSVFLMYYHLVFVVKYRRKIIDDSISDRLKEIFEYIAPNYNISLQEWNHDMDHVHILIKGQPNSELSKFINAYKSASSRLIKKESIETLLPLFCGPLVGNKRCSKIYSGSYVSMIPRSFRKSVVKGD